MTEDVLTGLRIHAKGWRSVYLTPEPPAFLGNAPTGGPASLTQYKRWATGLLEILFGVNSPIVATLCKQLSFRQCMAYLMINTWALGSIVEFCYALIPAYCFLANVSFLPKVIISFGLCLDWAQALGPLTHSQPSPQKSELLKCP